MKSQNSISIKSRSAVESKIDSRRRTRQGKKIIKPKTSVSDHDFNLLLEKEKELKSKISIRQEKYFKEVTELKSCIRELEGILQPYRGLKVPDDSLKLNDTLPKTIKRIYDYQDQIDKEDKEYLKKMMNEIQLK